MKNIHTFEEFLNESGVNEANDIKVGIFVRYKKDKDFTGGKVISIKGDTVEIHNWDGSTIELPLKDLEYVKSWNESGINEADMSRQYDEAEILNPFRSEDGMTKVDPVSYT
jgi:hypothetical protein